MNNLYIAALLIIKQDNRNVHRDHRKLLYIPTREYSGTEQKTSLTYALTRISRSMEELHIHCAQQTMPGIRVQLYSLSIYNPIKVKSN